MVVIEGTFYRMVYRENEGLLEIEPEPWELTFVLKGSVSEEYYCDVLKKLGVKGFSVERKGNSFMLKGVFSDKAKEVFEYAEKILEEYETKIVLKKTVC